MSTAPAALTSAIWESVSVFPVPQLLVFISEAHSQNLFTLSSLLYLGANSMATLI